MTRVCGYPNLLLPVTVYERLGGSGGGLSYLFNIFFVVINKKKVNESLRNEKKSKNLVTGLHNVKKETNQVESE